MPKGVSIRKPQPLEMQAAIINIPTGADVLEEFSRLASETGYMPLVILSAIGVMTKAVLRVPNDEAIPEITDVPNPFGVEIDLDGTRFEESRNLPIAMVPKNYKMPDGDIPKKDGFKPPPHWSSVRTYEHPLRLIYAHGGRSSPTSKIHVHFIVSGSKERENGISESFVGRLLPGCIAGSPLQFIVGVKPTLSNVTVRGWSVSIEPGFEVLEMLQVFLKARQTSGRLFIFSAIGWLAEAELLNLTADGQEEAFQLCPDNGPYKIEGMSGKIGPHPTDILIHAAIVLNCDSPPCDAAGGRVTRAIVSSEGTLDMYIGEMIEETDFFELM